MIYLDTSFLAPFYIREATSTSVEAILTNIPTQELAISDWTIVEFASLVSRRIRTKESSLELMEAVMRLWKEDVTQSYIVFTVTNADFILASKYIEQWETGLRTGDALHLAIASNRGVTNLLSLDRGLINAARQLGIACDSGGLL